MTFVVIIVGGSVAIHYVRKGQRARAAEAAATVKGTLFPLAVRAPPPYVAEEKNT